PPTAGRPGPNRSRSNTPRSSKSIPGRSPRSAMAASFTRGTRGTRTRTTKNRDSCNSASAATTARRGACQRACRRTRRRKVIRHPVREIDESNWLFSLMDRTLVYNPKTDAVADFGEVKHGLVPIVRTPKGTLVSGDAKRSTDGGKTWQKIEKFPEIA